MLYFRLSLGILKLIGSGVLVKTFSIAGLNTFVIWIVENSNSKLLAGFEKKRMVLRYERSK